MEHVLDTSGFILLQGTQKKDRQMVTPWILVLLTMGSMMSVVRSVLYPEIEILPVFAAILAAGTLLWGVSGKPGRLCAGVGGILVVLSALVLCMAGYGRAGVLDLLNRFLACFNYVTGMAVDYYVLPSAGDTVWLPQVTLLFITVAATLYVGLVIIRRHFVLLMFLWLCILAGSIFLERKIDGVTVACAAVSVIGTFAYSRGNPDSDRIMALWLLVMTILISISAVVYFHFNHSDSSEIVADMNRYVGEKVEEFWYGSSDSPLGSPERQGEPASGEIRLRVTASSPVLLYLRGYTGGVWEQDRWKPLSGSSYAQRYEGMIKGYADYSFHPLAQMNCYMAAAGQAGYPVAGKESIQVSVRNVSASRRYRYIPYGITYESLIDIGESDQDTNVPGNTSKEEENISYSAVVSQAPTDYFLGHVDTVWLNDTSKEITGDYAMVESDYRNFVYLFYLDTEKAEERYGNIAGLGGDLLETTKKIREAVKQDGEQETWNSFQYASDAAKLYRLAGVPSRYVEGYLADIRRKGSGDCYEDICADDVHGWVEIYRDGVGWVPVEVTPGYYEDMASSGDKKEEADRKQQESTGTAQQTQNQTPPVRREPGKMGRILAAAGIVLAGILFCIAIFIILRRQFIIYRRKKKLRSCDMWNGLEFWISCLKRIFSFCDIEEGQLPEEISRILNFYWYSCQAKEHLGEAEVQAVEKYVQDMQDDIKAGLPFFKVLSAKYIQVVI